MVSPFLFLILLFSSFLQAYLGLKHKNHEDQNNETLRKIRDTHIFPVALVWQAQTSPKPPLPGEIVVMVGVMVVVVVSIVVLA